MVSEKTKVKGYNYIMRIKLNKLFFNIPNANNDYVSYENQLQPRCIFNNNELKNLFYEHYDYIMTTVETAITEYINCEDLCNDSEDMFPRKSFLTGEWYISEINFDEMDYLSVQTAFIGTDTGNKDDYLGLEVHLYYNDKTSEFTFDGIDSYAM